MDEIEAVAKLIYDTLQRNQVLSNPGSDPTSYRAVPWAHPMNIFERKRFLQAAEAVITQLGASHVQANLLGQQLDAGGSQ